MKNEMQMVREFRNAFALPVSDTLNVPAVGQRELHAKMIADEAQEIVSAETPEKVRDVIGDLLYFIFGLASEAGVSTAQIAEDFPLIHDANMRKLWNESEVNELCASLYDAAELYSNTDDPNGWSVKKCDGSNMFTVRYNGKIQKPPGWKAATLRKIGGGE